MSGLHRRPDETQTLLVSQRPGGSTCLEESNMTAEQMQPGGPSSSNQSVLVQQLRREVAADETRLVSADVEPELGLLQCEATSFLCVVPLCEITL